mmetsp:Transcript_14716/g.26122  ORF Transcript_14716/g.26122 Transcript_14716/m.26122 type:complete len:240 (-) Transcript_14716:1160-1879(-)
MALAKMSWVARWSAITILNSAVSFSRVSLAFAISSSLYLMSLFAAAISSLRVLMDLSRVSIFASRSLFCSFLSKVSFSFEFMSSPHFALNCTSSACSAFRSATILSIISLTFVKLSSCTDTARVASFEFALRAELRGELRPCHSASKSSAKDGSRALLQRKAIARERRALAAESALERSCKKLVVFARCSRASSSVRTAMASETALTSSARVVVRSSYFLSKSWQVSLRLRKNFTSAER